MYVDLATSDYGDYVSRAAKILDAELKMPPGYSVEWAGEYEFELRARRLLLKNRETWKIAAFTFTLR